MTASVTGSPRKSSASFFQLHQYHGADGLCFVFCTVNAHAPFSAHMAFYRTDRALRICDSLPSCTFSHQSFSFFCKSYDAGCSHAPGGSGDDDRHLIFPQQTHSCLLFPDQFRLPFPLIDKLLSIIAISMYCQILLSSSGRTYRKAAPGTDPGRRVPCSRHNFEILPRSVGILCLPGAGCSRSCGRHQRKGPSGSPSGSALRPVPACRAHDLPVHLSRTTLRPADCLKCCSRYCQHTGTAAC